MAHDAGDSEGPKLRRELSIWEAIGISLALMAPSMAANINPQGTAGLIGRAVPLAFVLATMGVLLVAYTFVRLAQRFHHSGSVYGFVGATLGPRAGVLAGWALTGTYVFYGVVTSIAFGRFGSALLDSLGIWKHQGTWVAYVLALIGLVGIYLLAISPARKGTRLLLLIEGVTVRNSPMWEINPVLCRNVTVRDVKIDNHGPNNDGCDPESCTDVLIDNCLFDTGDDCIAIKSGRNRDGRRIAVPSQNIIVRNCVMKDGHGGVTIGSEASGDVRNVFVENCKMDSPHLNIALRIKTNSFRGGKIENIFMRNCPVGQVSGAVLDIDLFYEEG